MYLYADRRFALSVIKLSVPQGCKRDVLCRVRDKTETFKTTSRDVRSRRSSRD